MGWLSDLLRSRRRGALPAVAAGLALAAGFAIGERFSEARRPVAAFPDLLVNHAADYTGLVEPDAGPVQRLARELDTLEAAYLHVRDRVAFDPSLAAASPGQILADGRASCLGKATLLVSLYRALGIPAGDVRVVTGQVAFSGSVLDHAWVDLHYGSLDLQLDPTDLYGVHDFLAFPGDAYARAFVQREIFCFNDQAFAAVSQLNRIRGQHP